MSRFPLFINILTPKNPSFRLIGMRGIAQSQDVEKPDQLYRYLWLKCSSHHPDIMESYAKFALLAAENLDIEYVRTHEPFRLIKRRSMLASRFVHKKYRVQYEVRTYYKNLLFKNLTGSTADTFLEYVERNIPEGMMLIAERHKLDELPFDLDDESVTTEKEKQVKKEES